MTSLNALYSNTPVFAQNLVTTARGFQLRRLRYTTHTWRTLEFLNDSQGWSEEQFSTYQLERLRRLIEHACAYVPYYRERYSSLGIDTGFLKGLDDVRLLPIISKEEFRQNNMGFISTHLSRKRMWVAYTSGTTGTPLTAYHTHENMQERLAFMDRLYRWYNPRPWRRRASFTGKLVADPDRDGPLHRTNLAINQQLYSSHHLTDAHLDQYIDELAAFDPEQIDGIASPIFVVADHIVRAGRIGEVKPRVVIPTSETIWPYLRSRIEQGFGCPVANQYGSQEGAPLAYECPEGGFHVCPESGIFEILGPDDTPCETGELGRLVVTSFLSDGTPLIRYDIGDIAAWRSGDCPCGRQMPMLETVQGRIDDMFFTSERGIVPRIDSAFKSMPAAIKATQIAQIGIDQFEVRIVPDPEIYQQKYAEDLVAHLYDYLGRSVNISTIEVSELPRTSGGKLRAMVNESSEVQSLVAEYWNKANRAVN